MNIVNRYLKKRIIKKYIFEMAPQLVKRYGVLDEYTVLQLEKTTKSCRISAQYLPYAIALFRNEESENTLKLYNIDQSFLDILRKELTNAFFDGYAFKTKDVLKLARPKSWRGGHNTDNLSNRLGMSSKY